MATVTLSYRDGDNYKCEWEAEVPDEVMRALPRPDADGMHEITRLGLEVTGIPLISGHGFDDTADHPYVTVKAVQYDDEQGPHDKESEDS